jgi:hypothetical protein
MSKQQHIFTGIVCGGSKNGTGDGGSGVDCTMIERVEVVSHLNQLGRWSRALSWYEMLQSPPPPRANMLVGSPGGSTAEKGNSWLPGATRPVGKCLSGTSISTRMRLA